MKWTVKLTRTAAKQRERLTRDGKRPSITDTIDFLMYDLEDNGPYLSKWPNYGLIEKGKKYYHCHLRKGHPTYVACWEVIDEETKKIEVFYVGTHENAPY